MYIVARGNIDMYMYCTCPLHIAHVCRVIVLKDLYILHIVSYTINIHIHVHVHVE